jgi:hypothetical protein
MGRLCRSLVPAITFATVSTVGGIWETVGDDASLADTNLRRKNLKLQELALDHASASGSGSAPTHFPVPAAPGIESVKPEQAKSPVLLNDAIKEYLAETKNHKSGKTYAAYRKTLYLFSPGADENDSSPEVSRWFENKPLAEITRKDLLDYKEFLEKRGNSPRTVRNRIDYLQIFLHHFGLTSLLKGKDLPKFTKKKVRAYNPVLLAKIFDAAHRTSLIFSTSCFAPEHGSRKHSSSAGPMSILNRRPIPLLSTSTWATDQRTGKRVRSRSPICSWMLSSQGVFATQTRG